MRGFLMADRVAELVANALRISPDQITDGLEFQSIPEWDSVGHAGVILALEDELGVTLSEDQAVELTSYRAIRDFLQRHNTRGAAAD
jgi:citrate synthase